MKKTEQASGLEEHVAADYLAALDAAERAQLADTVRLFVVTHPGGLPYWRPSGGVRVREVAARGAILPADFPADALAHALGVGMVRAVDVPTRKKDHR